MNIPDFRASPALRSTLSGALVWAMGRLRDYFSSPRFWASLLLAVLVVSIIGPFQTREFAEFGPRVAYWAIVLVPVVLGIFALSIFLRELARRLDVAWGWPSLVAGLLGSGIVVVAVIAASHLTIGTQHLLPMPALVIEIVLITVPITMAINAVMPVPQHIWFMPLRVQPSRTPSPEDLPAGPLQARMPEGLGTNVIWARADNHHIELATTRGRARVHLKLVDAEAELAALPGFRVHRSWWANLDHATHFEPSEREGHSLLMIDGTRVPVSRAKRAKVEQALAQTDGVRA